MFDFFLPAISFWISVVWHLIGCNRHVLCMNGLKWKMYVFIGQVNKNMRDNLKDISSRLLVVVIIWLNENPPISNDSFSTTGCSYFHLECFYFFGRQVNTFTEQWTVECFGIVDAMLKSPINDNGHIFKHLLRRVSLEGGGNWLELRRSHVCRQTSFRTHANNLFSL